ncbi:MAG TPA: DUF2298 domain-containing protein [Anaerolineaceae bacterium]|nr:DUF2298 domain-containing protein [Anaerolineaceae bacterium]
MVTDQPEKKKRANNGIRGNLVWDLLLIVVLLAGAIFRFTGIQWDGNQHLHPDERFLTMVETGIAPVKSVSDYFDTATSSLNPNNRGYTFYVYGTLPLFIVRYAGEWVGKSGYDQINVVGRVLSGVFDLGTILFIYLIARRLYRHARLGLLAAGFSALAVLQIQLSHYFTVDNFANFFTYGALLTAVHIATSRTFSPVDKLKEKRWKNAPDWLTTGWRSAWLYALFGLLYGMALASKVSIWALAALLPLAAWIYYKNLHEEEKAAALPVLIRNLALAGVIAFVSFRVFQPYAFSGPGFFGLKLNPNWLSNMRELSTLMKGDVDVPYALQWARRPLTFTIQNLVLWGLGVPLGVLSLSGLVWMTWRIIRGDWKKHILIWSWTLFVLVTQSLNFVKSMRYIISIYPALALIAAWTIFKLLEKGSAVGRKRGLGHFNWGRILSWLTLVVTLLATTLWAAAFSSIYTKPVTRVAASEWIYENIPGAINLKISGLDGQIFTQPYAYQNTAVISSENPYRYQITAVKNGQVNSVSVQHVLLHSGSTLQNTLLLSIYEYGQNGKHLAGAGFTQADFSGLSDNSGDQALIQLQTPVPLEAGRHYELEFSVAEPGTFLRIGGSVAINTSQWRIYLPQPVFQLTSASPYQLLIHPRETGKLDEIVLNRVADQSEENQVTRVKAFIYAPDDPQTILASAELVSRFANDPDLRGQPYTLKFDEAPLLEKNKGYSLLLQVEGSAVLGVYNSITALESTWDDALPVGLYGYNQFGYIDGIYGNHLNMELYWDDNAEKLERLTSILDQADALFISSNRQWGTIPRVPERYPLTSQFYRSLIGCPEQKDILWCYAVAKPGIFQGELGYKLTAVFQNDPALGPFKINDQLAEEAFTVYDHPKVLVFEKTSAYDPDKTAKTLKSVDLTSVVHKTPRQASRISGNLMLTAKEEDIQTAGGTWRELFPPESPLNRQPWLAAVTWYVVVMLLGWTVYPLVRFFFRGLLDRGYGFSRLVGLLFLAYLTWMAGSMGLPSSRVTISLVFLLLLSTGVAAAALRRGEIWQEIRKNSRRFLIIEGVFLALFVLDLAIRIGNPDLWHPWKGGEKPMDLSYFTAVLKSTTFPPYDPWYSGGYINYYYYGFVIVAVLVKWLGIEPAIAYNLILPTLFAFTGIGAYTVGWNLFARLKLDDRSSPTGEKRSYQAGLAAAAAVLIAGNLGTLKMLWQGLQRLAAPGGIIDGAGFFERLGWFFSGVMRFVNGARLPYGFGDWYWNPSRAIPGDVITEFPFFTFTYADLHAHMIALPITLLVLGWVVSILFRNWEAHSSARFQTAAGLIITILFGGFTIVTLRPTNTWDLPTYFLLAVFVLFYSSYRNAQPPSGFLPAAPCWLRRILYSMIFIGVLAAGVMLFYLPFTEKFGQAYGMIDVWKGDHSPLGSYLVHWGWQLFLIVSWFAWETRDWLASTPASAIRRMKPYLGYLQVIGVLFTMVVVLLTLLRVHIGWLVCILGVWALVLLLRPHQADSKRLVLFMTGTALVLTLFVELFALQGDIGRMNTVFKFYFQAWTLLAIAASAALLWLIPAATSVWKSGISTAWQVLTVILIAGSLLYPLTASMDKIRDRMSASAPIGLDGDAFMQSATYFDQGVEMDLNQDYQAVQWMRENVQGSPVIIETNTVEYRWGNRFTIYTGLPGVLGWNWHQRQQRGFLDYNGINNRLNDIPLFYQTTDIEQALEILKRYQVKYIILGQMERAYYSGAGLDKFANYDGLYWKEVFHEKDTVIYEMID